MDKIIKILITGDSFAAPWPFAKIGWVNMLAHYYDVTNLAQAGVGEYKILKQIESTNIDQYDIIIVSHTSPSRVHTPRHPIHKEGFHKNCDLLYNDIADRNSWFNPSLKAAQNWFDYHYDDPYQIDIYNLIRKQINDILCKKNYISITHTEISKDLSIEPNNIDFSNLWKKERGPINHYTVEGNKAVFKQLKDIIDGK